MTKNTKVIQELKNYCRQETEKSAKQLRNLNTNYKRYNYFITWKKAHIEMLEKIEHFKNN